MTPTFASDVAAELERLHAAVVAAYGEPADRSGVVIALSGGPDSVALLDVARRWAADTGRRIVAAHFDHQLRGTGADADEAFCRQLCADLGVELDVERGDVRGLARQRGRGLEDAGRQLRDAFLERVRRQRTLAAVATGHHRDDQVETVLLRVFRGTGLDGLRGIRPWQGRRIHPLLAWPRPAILDHLVAHGYTWREDATNRDGSNRRGRVRHELMPLVRDIFGPGSGEAIARLADLAETDLAYLDERTEAAWEAVLTEAPEGLCAPALSTRAMAALPAAIAGRVLRRWLAPHVPEDLAQVHVEAILRWLGAGQSGSGLDLPGPVRIERVFDAIGLAADAPLAAAVEDWRVTVAPLPEIPDPVPGPRREVDGWRMVCAAEALSGSLRLRHPRQGDRLEPFGLGGSKKVSDLCREQRIPAATRSQLLVVEDATGPLWIPGVAQDERTRVLPTTRQAVTIFVNRRHRESGR
ncbi:tRNA lysidine(34) synthetase TilS [bacterium]|nr:tRNA lysidine(34) synthetase TilS [bacterium]